MPEKDLDIVRTLLKHMTINEAFTIALRQVNERHYRVSEKTAEVLASQLVGALRRFSLDTRSYS